MTKKMRSSQTWIKAYWIRTIPANNCSNFLRGGIPDERQGILNYRNNSLIIPTTDRGEFSIECRDEAYGNLVPYHAWNITRPSTLEEHKLIRDKPFEVGVEKPQPPHGMPFPCDKFSRWSMGKEPMFLDFGDPTILHLTNDPTTFKDREVVVNYTQDSWV